MDALQPFKPDRSGNCQLSGFHLYYEIYGECNPQKLILTQGAFCTLKVFGAIGYFLSKHCSVLLYDSRGVRRSTAPAKWPRPTSDQLAEDAELLLQHVWPDQKVHVFGASMGGMISQMLALRLLRQNKISSLTLAVTTLNTPFRIIAPMFFIRAYCWMFLARSPRHMAKFLLARMLSKEELALDVTTPEGTPTTLGKAMLNTWLQDYNEWYCIRDPVPSAAHLNVVFSHSLQPEQVTDLAGSGLPILVIIAKHDTLIPVRVQYATARRLNAHTMELDSGHMMASKVREVAERVWTVIQMSISRL